MRVSSVPEDLCACEDLCGGPLLSREDLWSITSIFVITTLMRSVLARLASRGAAQCTGGCIEWLLSPPAPPRHSACAWKQHVKHA